jgi:hypothetical protein
MIHWPHKDLPRPIKYSDAPLVAESNIDNSDSLQEVKVACIPEGYEGYLVFSHSHQAEGSSTPELSYLILDAGMRRLGLREHILDGV